MANFNGLSVIANREAIRSGEELLVDSERPAANERV